MNRHRRATRLAAGLLAGALALSVAPLAGLAGADNHIPPAATPLGEGNFCDGAPDTNPFTDLDQEVGNTREVILCLVATGLTQGTTPTTYSPGEPVNRRQMALFIKRLADLLVDNQAEGAELTPLPAYDGEPDFSDVAETDPGAEAIGQLEQAGIIGGFPDGTFRPNDDVSRRQMAKFIVELLAHLDERPVASDDYFDDDTNDSGEANLNRLAEVGIFQGDGEGNVFPGDDIARRQMANVVMRTAQVFLTDGLVESPFADDGDGDGDGDTNATLTVEPITAEMIEYVDGIDAETAEDDRTYTVTGLESGQYTIDLVRYDKIHQDEDGTYTFDEEGSSGLVENGDVVARIVTVNGAVIGASQWTGGVQPQNGTITFTVDGDGTEVFFPVVALDGGTHDRLEVDDDGLPTEVFGVGGQLTYIAPEAAGGSPVNGTVLLARSDLAVVDSGVSEATVRFRSGDTHQLADGVSSEPMSAEDFHEALSRGDTLRTCGESGEPAPYNDDAPNGYCLTDDGSAAPTGLEVGEGSSPDTSVFLSWEPVEPVDGYNIYLNPQACSNTTVDELVLHSTARPWETLYEATGLTPSTTYCWVVTSFESGDERGLAVGTENHGDDNTAQRATTGPVEAPTITSAEKTTDVDTSGLTEGDVVTLVLSEAMDPDTLEDATFSVTDANEDTTDLLCAGTPLIPLPIPQADDGQTEMDCALDEDGVTLTMTVSEDGDDDNTAGDNDGIQFSLVITAAAGLTDADDGLMIDVENSADTLIS